MMQRQSIFGFAFVYHQTKKHAVVIVDLRQKQKQAERRQNVLHLVKSEMAKCLKVPQ